MYELDFKKIGLEMKRLRTERSITQEKIARDLGCTVAFISNVENNHAKLNLRLVNYYARLCNVSVDSILDAGREDPVRADVKSARDEDLLRVFHQYPDDHRREFFCGHVVSSSLYLVMPLCACAYSRYVFRTCLSPFRLMENVAPSRIRNASLSNEST